MSTLYEKLPKQGVALLVCFAIGIFYLYFSLSHNLGLFVPSESNYYTYLLDAFLHERVAVTPPSTYDLSFYQGKWYLYWGPAPVLFVFPFYIFTHLQTSDRLYTLIGGVGNVILFYFIMQQFQKYFKISLSRISEIFLLLSFGLVSPNFFLSLHGTIWFTNQIFATTYLLLFYLSYFLFLNKQKHRFFILATLFFYLAIFSRYSLVFNGILYFYLWFHFRRKIPFEIFRSFGFLTLIFITVFCFYNYLRFENILDIGQQYQQGAERFDAILKENRVLSLSYFWHNFYHYFLHIVHFVPTNRPVVIDVEGNSVFSVYPTLLLLPVLLYKMKSLSRKQKNFLFIGSIIAVISTCFLMIYFATGWVQFGNRYFFDVLPILFFMLIFILRYVPGFVQLIILLFGIFVNVYGLLAFIGK